MLFPVRDLDLLARATPPSCVSSRRERSPAPGGAAGVATEHDDHELIDAMAPIGAASTGMSPRTPTPDRQSPVGRALAAALGLDRVRRRHVAGRERQTTQRRHAQPAAGGRRRAGPAPSSRRGRRHRRRRQQTEAAHRRALARLDRLRLPDDTPNPYQAKAAPGKRRSTG